MYMAFMEYICKKHTHNTQQQQSYVRRIHAICLAYIFLYMNIVINGKTFDLIQLHYDESDSGRRAHLSSGKFFFLFIGLMVSKMNIGPQLLVDDVCTNSCTLSNRLR